MLDPSDFNFRSSIRGIESPDMRQPDGKSRLYKDTYKSHILPSHCTPENCLTYTMPGLPTIRWGIIGMGSTDFTETHH